MHKLYTHRLIAAVDVLPRYSVSVRHPPRREIVPHIKKCACTIFATEKVHSQRFRSGRNDRGMRCRLLCRLIMGRLASALGHEEECSETQQDGIGCQHSRPTPMRLGFRVREPIVSEDFIGPLRLADSEYSFDVFKPAAYPVIPGRKLVDENNYDDVQQHDARGKRKLELEAQSRKLRPPLAIKNRKGSRFKNHERLIQRSHAAQFLLILGVQAGERLAFRQRRRRKVDVQARGDGVVFTMHPYAKLGGDLLKDQSFRKPESELPVIGAEVKCKIVIWAEGNLQLLFAYPEVRVGSRKRNAPF